MPDLFSGMWMTFSGMVEGDAKLNVPYTAKAQKYVDAYKPKRDIPYAEEGCQSPGSADRHAHGSDQVQLLHPG